MHDRRLFPRHVPGHDDPLSRVRLRVGRELTVVDVSMAGVLVEGEGRLLPGTHLDVHVMTAQGRVLVRSRIVRAYVCALSADMVVYRGAFAFERPIANPHGYRLPQAMPAANSAQGTVYPERAA